MAKKKMKKPKAKERVMISVDVLEWAYELAVILSWDTCGYADDIRDAILKAKGESPAKVGSAEMRARILSDPRFRHDEKLEAARIIDRLKKAGLTLKVEGR